MLSKVDTDIKTDGSSFDFEIDGAASFGGSTKAMSDPKMTVISNMMPNLDGTERSNAATVGFMSLKVLLDALEELGYIWYLEESGGDYYFRIVHITERTFGSSNPDITDYFGKDYHGAPFE